MPPPSQLNRPSAILWDMDGTLIDQSAAILRGYASVITQMGYPEPDKEVIRRSLGGPMASTMGLFVRESELDEACAAFRTLFPSIMFDGLIILPGASELIRCAYQSGIAQALLTNKHGATARQISNYAGFSKYVPLCVGSGDTEWHKPDVALTRYVLDQIGASAANAAIIGDSPTDIAVAQNAGFACYCVSTGVHSPAELNESGATRTFASLRELGEALNL